jgi:hypothetical protein
LLVFISLEKDTCQNALSKVEIRVEELKFECQKAAEFLSESKSEIEKVTLAMIETENTAQIQADSLNEKIQELEMATSISNEDFLLKNEALIAEFEKIR